MDVNDMLDRGAELDYCRAEMWRWRKLALAAICGFGGAVAWMVVTALLGN